jgi:hypothetical protein
MSRNTSRINASYTDGSINAILHRTGAGGPTKNALRSCGYNQNEDQFLSVEKYVEIPSLPVHHPMNDTVPPSGYLDAIAALAESLMAQCPELVAGTDWYFDPVSIHTPTFYRVVTYGNVQYLYHVLIDLTCHPLECEILETGTNNRTHAYRTKRLYFESDFFPLAGFDEPLRLLTLNQTIPVTWKGEAGQGYMIHGLWMDSDINKFFSKLILPVGKRNHPYYPVTCKQHCISMNAFGQESPVLLHRITEFIGPALHGILDELQSAAFSETMPLFARLKETIPPELGEYWKNLTVSAFLNERDQKEYTVEF